MHSFDINPKSQTKWKIVRADVLWCNSIQQGVMRCYLHRTIETSYLIYCTETSNQQHSAEGKNGGATRSNIDFSLMLKWKHDWVHFFGNDTFQLLCFKPNICARLREVSRQLLATLFWFCWWRFFFAFAVFKSGPQWPPWHDCLAIAVSLPAMPVLSKPKRSTPELRRCWVKWI